MTIVLFSLTHNTQPTPPFHPLAKFAISHVPNARFDERFAAVKCVICGCVKGGCVCVGREVCMLVGVCEIDRLLNFAISQRHFKP